jgi:uncharacterized membrane-anchored protein
MNWRTLVLWGTALLVVAWTGLLTWQKEQLLAQGRPVLLRLAPVDPRSLIQGDYMLLRYDLPAKGVDTWPTRGTLVATLDAQGVVQSARLYDGRAALGANEQLLAYHLRGSEILVAAESFFFQEGSGEAYVNARYGELRAAPDGETLLFGLRDEALRPLGRPIP